MTYTLIINGQSYDLPKKDLQVMEKLEQILKIDSNTKLTIRQKFKELHNFIIWIVGENQAEEILGSNDLESIDLSELAICVKKIQESYDKPLVEYSNTKTNEMLRSIDFDKILKVANATNSMGVTK